MNQSKIYTILIKNKKNKKKQKKYMITFSSSFEAYEWGEKQASEFGPDYYAELS